MRHIIQRLQRELGLTILLSSHFLSEVEQICTRIAVLNQGRMVFEGTLADTRQSQRWVRLKVGDYAAAIKELRRSNLITEDRDEQFIALNAEAGTDQVVKTLVAAGISVFEIAPHEETLETFYLRIMKPSAP
jgi:ABC-2 type transport system ATP-binding protein